MEENFYDAAVRHRIDGKILEESEEYDSAVCMQGFSAECALKKILLKGISGDIIKKYSHEGNIMFQDLVMMLMNDNEALSILDPACGLRLSNISLPQVLFENHPERRYYSDGKYSEEDARLCRESAEQILSEMFRLYLDGYIDDK